MNRSSRLPATSAAKAGWVVALVIIAVPVFIFWPRQPEEPREFSPPLLARPPSELTKVGLPDDPDLEGLPGFFAVWADSAEWKENKTIFAYRHPVSGEFSFFFEAARTRDGFRFRPVSRPQDATIRELGPSIPIAFFTARSISAAPTPAAPNPRLSTSPPAPKVQVDLGDAKGAAPVIEPPK